MRQALTAIALTISLCGIAQAQVGKNNNVLNPNLASAEQLAAVGKLDTAMIESIEARRHFASMLDFDELLGSVLDESVRAKLYAQVFLPINLNTASGEEMSLIPGVGKRMIHEFEEYRPYKNLSQWRREIGKYVDDEELARLEQYVFVPLELNTASEADFLTIPGVGTRMAHEFEEYRPYKSMAQWRREIGKYVDDEELMRLERYVFLRE